MNMMVLLGLLEDALSQLVNTDLVQHQELQTAAIYAGGYGGPAAPIVAVTRDRIEIYNGS